MSKLTSGGWLYEAREIVNSRFGTETVLQAVDALADSEFKDAQLVELVAFAMSIAYTGSEIFGVEERVPIMVSKKAQNELREFLAEYCEGTGKGYSDFVLAGIKALKEKSSKST